MTERETRFATDGLTALVIVSVAAAAANLTWRLAGEPGVAFGATSATGYVSAAPAPDLGVLASAQPFGGAVTSVAQASAAGLGFVLKGVLLASPRSASTVILAQGGAPSEDYAVGEALPGGTVVDRVGVDYVVLRTPAGLATLYFPDDERGKPPTPVSSGSAVVAAGPQPAAGAPLAGFNPRALLDSLGGGVTGNGYRVGGTLTSEMTIAGLQPGDLIQSVNGVDVVNMAGDPRLLESAVASGVVQLSVLRNGQRTTLTLPSAAR